MLTKSEVPDKALRYIIRGGQLVLDLHIVVTMA